MKIQKLLFYRIIICINIFVKKIEYFVERSLSNFIILRISNIYGDNDINKRDFLLNIVHKILKNKKITIFGSGKYHRDYLHLEDVNSAISAIIKKKKLQGSMKFIIYVVVILC